MANVHLFTAQSVHILLNIEFIHIYTGMVDKVESIWVSVREIHSIRNIVENINKNHF